MDKYMDKCMWNARDNREMFGIIELKQLPPYVFNKLSITSIFFTVHNLRVFLMFCNVKKLTNI